ncbi:MAG: alpha/beta hydrolase [Actinomycetota bacterium]|nr:alpha/beta hydrolase [Actinomycetota bacterium]
MYLNEFAPSAEPHDMSTTDEFASLLASAADLGIPHDADVSYRSRHVIVRHQRFHYLEWGDPAHHTVLLLHGGNQSAHSWDLVSLHLANRFHVLALDQRGHGDSEWARDADYSSTAMAADAAAFLDDLDVGQVTIVGHSMGGMNTMRLMLEQPERADRVVLVDIGPEMSEEGAKSIRSFVTEHREFDDLDHFVEVVQKYDPYRSREHIERTVKYNLLQRADGKFVSKRDHGPRLSTTQEHRSRHDRFTIDDAPSMTMPTLLIRGADSNILTAESAARFAAALPDGNLVTVPESGHNVHGQNTPGFLEAILPFLMEVAD